MALTEGSLSRRLQILAPVIATFVFLASFGLHYYFMRFGSKAIIEIPTGSDAQEFLLRLVWAFSSSALATVIVASIVLSLCTLRRNVPPNLTRQFVGTTILLAAVVLGLLKLIDLGGGAGQLLINEGERLLNEGTEFPLPIDAFVETTSLFSGLATVLILVTAASLICAVLHDRTQEAVRAAYDYWTANLIVTALFLVVGSLEIRFLYQWMVAVVSADPAVGHALSLGAAILYTIILITIFLPTSIVLELQIRRLGGAPKKRSELKDWRIANDLGTRFETLGKYALMLAPAIFGAFAELPIWGLR